MGGTVAEKEIQTMVEAAARLIAITDSVDEIEDEQIAEDMRWLLERIGPVREWIVLRGTVDLSPPGVGRWHLQITNGIETQELTVPLEILASGPVMTAGSVTLSAHTVSPSLISYPVLGTADTNVSTFGPGLLK